MNFISQIQYWLGEIPLPNEMDKSHSYVVHLFDTPSYTYLLLNKLLSQVNVTAVIHNGNLSSQIDLSKFPFKTIAYESHLNLFAKVLKRHQIDQLYICLSPIDHTQSIQRTLPYATVFEHYGEAYIEDFHFVFSYDRKNLPERSGDFNLSRNLPFQINPWHIDWTPNIRGGYFIELIDLVTREIWKLPYPQGYQPKLVQRI